MEPSSSGEKPSPPPDSDDQTPPFTFLSLACGNTQPQPPTADPQPPPFVPRVAPANREMYWNDELPPFVPRVAPANRETSWNDELPPFVQRQAPFVPRQPAQFPPPATRDTQRYSRYTTPPFSPPDVEIVDVERSWNSSNSPPVLRDFLSRSRSTGSRDMPCSIYTDSDAGPSLSGTKRSISDLTKPNFSPQNTNIDPNSNPNQSSSLESNHQPNINPNQNPNPNLNLAHNNPNLNPNQNPNPNLNLAHNNPNLTPNNQNPNREPDRYPNFIPGQNPHIPILNPNNHSYVHPSDNPNNFPNQNPNINSGRFQNLNLERNLNVNPNQNASLNSDHYNFFNQNLNPNHNNPHLNPNNHNSHLNRNLNPSHNPNLNQNHNTPNLGHYHQRPSFNFAQNPNPNSNPDNHHSSLNHAHNLNPVPNPHSYFNNPNHNVQRDNNNMSFLSLNSNPLQNSNQPKTNARMFSRLPPPPPRRVPAVVEKLTRNCEAIRSMLLSCEPCAVPDNAAFPGATKVVLKKVKKGPATGNTSNSGQSPYPLGRQMVISYGTQSQVFENVNPAKFKHITAYAASTGPSVPTSHASGSTNTQINSTNLLSKIAHIPSTELRLNFGPSGVIDVEGSCSPKDASPGNNTSAKEPDVQQPSQNEIDNNDQSGDHVQPLPTEMNNNQKEQPSLNEIHTAQNTDQNVQHSRTETDNGQNGNQTKGNEADARRQ